MAVGNATTVDSTMGTNKMRKLKGIRKLILIEEAWKAIASANMADYIKYLYKTSNRFYINLF